MLGERAADASSYVFHEFDSMNGRGDELVRIEDRPPFTNWALSADGTMISVVHNDDNRVGFVNLVDGSESEITVEGWAGFEFVTWSKSGAGVYLNAGSPATDYPALIHLDLNGQVTLLRSNPHEWHVFPHTSPDGRHLAFAVMPFHGNVWLIDR